MIGDIMSNAMMKNEFLPLEAGDFNLRMNRIVEEPTKNGAGIMIKAGFEVINGDSKGRLVFHNFLVEHTSAKAAEIGNKQLNDFLKAVGVTNGMEDLGEDRSLLSEYLELPFIGSLGVEEAREYNAADGSVKIAKARNNIKKFIKR